MKAPDKKNKLIIDEKVSDVVRKIFQMYTNGIGSKKIIEYLNNNHYYSPSGYRKTGIVQDENKTGYDWNATTLCDMLKNEVYIGNTIQNKVSIVSYKVKKIRRVNEAQHIRVEHTHEAIIDKETFDKCQTLHKKRAKSCEKQYEYLLKGLIYCKHCGWKMQIVLKKQHKSNRQKIPYIVCTDSKRRNCYPRNLNYYNFEEKMLDIIRKVCEIYANRSLLEETYNKAVNKTIDITSTLKKQINTLKTQENECNNRIDMLYEDKLNGVLKNEDFVRISQKHITEREQITKKISELTEQLQALEGQKKTKINSDEQRLNEIINEFLSLKKPEKSILYRLINKIEIDKDKNIFIFFNFAPLNTIYENIDEFIDVDEIINNDVNVG